LRAARLNHDVVTKRDRDLTVLTVTRLMPQLSFVSVGKFWCLYLRRSISEL